MAARKRATKSTGKAKAKRKSAAKVRTIPHSFRWDARKEQAAQLLAEAELSVDEIAAAVGAGRRTIFDWQEHPEFAARVEEHIARLGQLAERFVICRRAARLSAKQRRWRKLQAIIDARAADPDHAKAPGGDTGLLVRRQKMLGSGDNAILVEELELDAALLREMSKLESEAAEEAGQKVQKIEHTGKDGGPMEQVIIYVPDNARDQASEGPPADVPA